MPFIAPLLGGALGGIAATAIGQAVIGAALTVAMGALARRLAPKPASQQQARSAHLRLAVDPDMPRVVVFGEAAVAGSLVYHNSFGNTAYLELVFALADHECHSMTGLWVNGRPVTWEPVSGDVAEYPNMHVRFQSGAYGQAANADLVANSGGRWTTSDRGRGVAYVYVLMHYDADLYKGRQPSFLFKVKGAKLYDWRKDSTAGGSGAHRWGQPSTYEWSDNPVVCWYNWRRGLYTNGVRVAGMATPADALPLTAATAAANACDESVALKAGGSEKRYRISAVIHSATRHREVIRDIAACVAGEEVDTGGELRLMPGIVQASVMSLTDDDLMSGAEVEWSGRQSRRDLVNAVFGSTRDPAQRYEAMSLVPRLSSADETTDGARHEQRYDLDFVSSPTQGQRCLEILRRRARRQGVAKATFRAKAAPLEPGDWITWDSARFGWVAKTFEVVTAAITRDLTTELVLREVDSAIYSWVPADDELDGSTVPNLPAGGGGIAAMAGLALANITVTSGTNTESRPGLRLTWTPVTDPSIIEVEIEIRKQGDANPIGSRKAFDPAAGQYAWVDGVIGGTVYEVRARPVPRPERPVTWSAWISAPAASAPVNVEVANATPAPESVGYDELDPQTRFELQLATALDAVNGSAAEQVREAYDWAQRAGEEALRATLDARDNKASIRVEQITRQTEDLSLASQITTVQANLDTANAAIITEQTARAAGDSANASSIAALSTTVGGHTATLAQHAASIDGIEARWGVVINVDGQVVGLVQLDGGASGSSFAVVADKFVVAHPSTPGTTIQAFVVGLVNGLSTVGINGNLIVDQTILARHLQVSSLSAISADIGTATAGILRSSDNKFRVDLNAKTLTIDT